MGANADTATNVWRLVDRRPEMVVVMTRGEIPFYLIHPIAGDVACYRGLAQALGPRISLRGVQTPRALLEAGCALSIEAMAQTRADAILAHAIVGPLCIGGWSAGAILALEVARKIRAAGREVPLLVAIDGAPCNAAPAPSKARRIFDGLANLPAWALDKISQRARTGQWRILEGIPCANSMDEDAIGGVLEATRVSPRQAAFVAAFHEAALAHAAAPYDGEVLSIEASVGRAMRPRQIGPAWSALCPAVRHARLRANHLGLMMEPSVTKVAAITERALVQAWDADCDDLDSRLAERSVRRKPWRGSADGRPGIKRRGKPPTGG